MVASYTAPIGSLSARPDPSSRNRWMRASYLRRRYRAHACRATGNARACVFRRSRSLRTRTIDLPDLHDRTGTFERRVDPCVGIVQERLRPRFAPAARVVAIRRKYGEPPSLPCQGCEQRQRGWVVSIVPFQDHERHVFRAGTAEVVAGADRLVRDVELVGIEPVPEVEDTVRGGRIARP